MPVLGVGSKAKQRPQRIVWIHVPGIDEVAVCVSSYRPWLVPIRVRQATLYVHHLQRDGLIGIEACSGEDRRLAGLVVQLVGGHGREDLRERWIHRLQSSAGSR